jgi:hypothetical protein
MRCLEYLMQIEIEVFDQFQISPYLNEWIRYLRATILESILSKHLLSQNKDIYRREIEWIQSDCLKILQILSHHDRVLDAIVALSHYYNVTAHGIHYEPGNLKIKIA